MPTLRVPTRLDLSSTINFANVIASADIDQPIIFDFTSLSWVKPFGMLFIAQAIKSLREKHPNYDITTKGLDFENNAVSYAAHMSLFRSCGFRYGNKPGYRTFGNATYLPITYASTKQLQTREAIEDLALEMARQLSRSTDGVVVDTLSYSFREMIRNVIEHSRSDTLGYCAQYWPSKGKAELALLDTGIGISQSLSKNPHLKITDDKDAVKYALMPGISGTTYEGVRLRNNDVWQNSGYGLYMNYRLCNEGGSFFICSGSTGLYRTSHNDNVYHRTNFQGTALRLEMNTGNLKDVQRLLQQFAEEGERMAKRVGMGAIPTASTMSKMLKDNFKALPNEIEVGDTVRHNQFGEGRVTEKTFTPQGEMLWISFNSGRIKKALSKDVILVNLDTETYEPVDDFAFTTEEYSDESSVSFDESQFEDTDFELHWDINNDDPSVSDIPW